MKTFQPFERILEPIDLRPHPRAAELQQEIQQQLGDLSRLKEMCEAQKLQIAHLSIEANRKHVKMTCGLIQDLVSKLFKEESSMQLHLVSLLQEMLAIQQTQKEDSVFLRHLRSLVDEMPQIVELLKRIQVLAKVEWASDDPVEMTRMIVQICEEVETLNRLDDVLTEALFKDLGYVSEYTCSRCKKNYVRYIQDKLQDEHVTVYTFQCYFCGFIHKANATMSS